MKKLLLLVLLLPSLAQAEFYLRPRAGAFIPVDDGDTSYSLGLTAGYRWTDFLATEASYSRLIGTGNAPDGDSVHGDAIVSFPLPVVTPYASAGFGGIRVDDWKTMARFGAGVTLDTILFLSVGGGISYAAVFDGPDYFEPYVAVGIGF